VQHLFLCASGAPNSRAAPGSPHSSYASGCGHWNWQQKTIASVRSISMMPCFKHPQHLIAVKVSTTHSKQLFCSANIPHRETVW